MPLEKLSIGGVRNISSVEFDSSARVNAFYGANGSGKSSILEAIHFLGLGRSFRCHSARSVVQHDAPHLTVHGKLSVEEGALSLGVQKFSNGRSLLRLNGVSQSSIAEFAHVLPVVVLEAESLRVLESGAQARRRLLDWGAFHFQQDEDCPFFGVVRI